MHIPYQSLQLKIDRKSGDAALLSMTQNVAARLETKTKKSRLSLVLQSHV
jgi:transcription initiation factor TFIIH subunit 1